MTSSSQDLMSWLNDTVHIVNNVCGITAEEKRIEEGVCDKIQPLKNFLQIIKETSALI